MNKQIISPFGMIGDHTVADVKAEIDAHEKCTIMRLEAEMEAHRAKEDNDD